ncbi:MAG: DUF3570 domain-containing protein [Aquificae bacterium]|nr:DUF3570 domain-containing protein [Aquificota bacterium]
MQIKKLLAGVMVLLPFTKGFSSPQEDKIGVGFNLYVDNADVEVYSPTFSLLKKITEKLIISLKTRIDAISAASIRNGGRPNQVDAVTGASYKEGFDDVRYAGSLSITYDTVNYSVTLGGYYSTEIDYEGRAIFANVIKQFNNQNTALGFGFSQSFDRWYPVFDRELPKEYRRERKLDISFTQLLSPTAMIQFIYTNLYSEGFLASPYHYVINNEIAKFEKYPDTRNANAFTVKLVKLITEPMSINLYYRYYLDDWDIKSHTINTEVLRDIKEDFTLGVRYRYYTQTKANFIKPVDQYTQSDKYFAIDYRMSSFSSNTIGISFIYKPSGQFFIDWDRVKLEGSIDYYFTSSNEYIKRWYEEDRLHAVFTSFMTTYTF